MSDTGMQASRDSVRSFYEQARSLREELLELQTVDQARAAFKDALGGEELRLETLKQRVAALEREKRLQLERLEHAPFENPEFDDEDDYEYEARDTDALPEEKGRAAVKEEPANAARLTQARKRFQRLVNRFHHFLRVSDANRAQINQIVEDPQRPLGEALVLLEWDTFENRIGPLGAESDEKYLERLDDWGESLREYIRKAQGDVRAVEVRYGEFVMLIWRAWRAEAAGERAEWERVIDNIRNAFAHQAAELEKQIDTLEAEIAALKSDHDGEVNHER
jgi:hypothetical protein